MWYRSKSSGCLEGPARAARAALGAEMRERERSASPGLGGLPAQAGLTRALPARVLPTNNVSTHYCQN